MIGAAVEPTERVLGAARALGIEVIYLKMAFRPDLSGAGAADSPNFARHLQLLGPGRPVQAPNAREPHLIRDTWNIDVIEELTPAREVNGRLRFTRAETPYRFRYPAVAEKSICVAFKPRSAWYPYCLG